jgi:hypothetical protein
VGGHRDLPASGHEDGSAVTTESEWIPRSLRDGFAPIDADYALSVDRGFAAAERRRTASSGFRLRCRRFAAA